MCRGGKGSGVRSLMQTGSGAGLYDCRIPCSPVATQVAHNCLAAMLAWLASLASLAPCASLALSDRWHWLNRLTVESDDL